MTMNAAGELTSPEVVAQAGSYLIGIVHTCENLLRFSGST